jgi:acyl carrier protein
VPAEDSARSIEPAIRDHVATELLYDRETPKIEPDEPLLSGLLDSLDVLNLVQFLEQQYGIRVEDEELIPENFETVRAVASLVSRKLSQGEAGT